MAANGSKQFAPNPGKIRLSFDRSLADFKSTRYGETALGSYAAQKSVGVPGEPQVKVFSHLKILPEAQN